MLTVFILTAIKVSDQLFRKDSQKLPVMLDSMSETRLLRIKQTRRHLEVICRGLGIYGVITDVNIIKIICETFIKELYASHNIITFDAKIKQ